MSRLVRIEQIDYIALEADDKEGYFDRVAKYIPGEIVAFYLTLMKVLSSAGASHNRALVEWLYGLSFVTFLALTPIYFTKMAKPGDAVKFHRIVATVAFVVWAYSLGGIFNAIGIQNDLVSGFLLIIFTAISGAIIPRK